MGSHRYDQGYASVDRMRAAGAEAPGVAAGSALWSAAMIRLQLGWLSAQLRINPDDEFRWGRLDALCDLLADAAPGRADDPLTALAGFWRKVG